MIHSLFFIIKIKLNNGIRLIKKKELVLVGQGRRMGRYGRRRFGLVLARDWYAGFIRVLGEA